MTAENVRLLKFFLKSHTEVELQITRGHEAGRHVVAVRVVIAEQLGGKLCLDGVEPGRECFQAKFRCQTQKVGIGLILVDGVRA